MFGYEFANPEYFWLLLVLIPMVIWYIFKEKRSHADLKFSSIRVFKQMKRGSRIWLRHLLFAARVLAILFLVLALARPQARVGRPITARVLILCWHWIFPVVCWHEILLLIDWRQPRRLQLSLYWSALRIVSDWLFLVGKVSRKVL